MVAVELGFVADGQILQGIEFFLILQVTMTWVSSCRNARLTARPNPPVPPATNTTLDVDVTLDFIFRIL